MFISTRMGISVSGKSLCQVSLFFHTFIFFPLKHLGNIYGGSLEESGYAPVCAPEDHPYMVTFPAACCGEGYRDMVVFIHTRVKDVGSD